MFKKSCRSYGGRESSYARTHKSRACSGLRPPNPGRPEGGGKHPNAPHHPGCPGWHCPVPSLPVPGATHYGRSGAISMDQHRGPGLASCAAQPTQAAVDLLEMVTDPPPHLGRPMHNDDPCAGRVIQKASVQALGHHKHRVLWQQEGSLHQMPAHHLWDLLSTQKLGVHSTREA